MPLSFADTDTAYTIIRIAGEAEIKNHLEKLGFVIGSKIRVTVNNGGNLIVSVKESRVAISRAMASKIFVS